MKESTFSPNVRKVDDNEVEIRHVLAEITNMLKTRLDVVSAARTFGLRPTARKFNVKPGLVQYWQSRENAYQARYAIAEKWGVPKVRTTARPKVSLNML